MRKNLLLQLIGLFLITQLLGLYVAVDLINHEIEPIHIVTDNPEDVENAIGLLVFILFFTAMLLVIIKFVKGWLFFKILETIAIFATSMIVFRVFIPDVAFMFSVLIVALRWALPKSIFLRNVSSVLAVAGAGAWIGISLGLFPVLVFVIALAVYDLIAVFGTKHMVSMAKALTSKNLSFTFALPTKEHVFELGTGDMVIPLLFTTSALNHFSQANPFPNYLVPLTLILLGSLAGLLWTINYSSKHVGKALPALPPQTICMVAMLVLSKLIGF